MNFLSHFYFERHTRNDYVVMGVLLPDLVKNVDKTWNINPQRDTLLYTGVEAYAGLLTGWKRHLEVDRLFHSSAFFREQTAILKQLILPAVETGPVKAFFLAHIALELLLDHLLLTRGDINAHELYRQLANADTAHLDEFLRIAGLPDGPRFRKFIEEFISSEYLLSYDDIDHISYSLNRICLRLWDHPFTSAQLDILSVQLQAYKDQLKDNYMDIFRQIEDALSRTCF